MGGGGRPLFPFFKRAWHFVDLHQPVVIKHFSTIVVVGFAAKKENGVALKTRCAFSLANNKQ